MLRNGPYKTNKSNNSYVKLHETYESLNYELMFLSHSRLLVVDREADAYYKQNDIVVTGQMPNILSGSSELNNDNENNRR